METRRRLLRYVMVYKVRLILAAVCGLFITGCSLFMASLINWFTAAADNKPVADLWVVRFGVEHGWFGPADAKSALIWIVALLAILIHVPKGIFAYFNAYLVASVTNRIGADVRSEMYGHLQTLPLSYFHKSKIGHILSRMSYDVGLIQNSSQVVMQAIDGPIMIVGGLARMFMLNWQLSLLAVICVPLMGVAIDRLAKRIKTLTTTTQIKLADVSAVAEESIRGVRIVKSFGMEDHEVKRFSRANTHSLIAALRAARRAALVQPTVEFMGAVAASLVILVGGWMVVRGMITFRALTEFTFLAFVVAAAFKQFGRLNVLYQQVVAAGERIFELLDAASDLPEKPDAVVLTHVEGRVEFRDVCFEYNPGEPVLDQVSFTIEPGEAVAIVGPSGAGKSTVADLIPRFYDVTSGAVLVEGHDVRDISIASLRAHIAIVPQETILFSGTIAENIAYGRPGAGMDDVIEVAKAANAHDFICEMPQGYETELGEAGVGLSGGQRQRIAIARALLKDPRILILDEATSSLDAASEGVVQEALDRLMRGRSTLVIAHRLSTVTRADRILVMDKGRVVEAGSFGELVACGGAFSQLYRAQFRPSTPAAGDV